MTHHMPLDLFPYQVEGAAFLAPRERAGLFDEMGVGKTAQAIRALDDVEAKRVIIVCPAAVREVWAGEIRKFSRYQRRVIKGRTIHDLGTWLRGRADVLLLSYEMAAKWTQKIEGDLFDALVLDECFPAGTLVETRFGSLPIDEIVERELPVDVWCQGPKGLKLRAVSRYIKTTGTQMVRVQHVHGEMLVTSNHKVWTDEEGYVAAGLLRPDHTLRVVRPGLSTRAEENQGPVLQPQMLGEVASEHAPRSRENQSHDRGGDACEDREASTRCVRTDETLERRSGVSRQSGRRVEVTERAVLVGEEGRQRFPDGAAEAVVRGPWSARDGYGGRDQDPSGAGPVSLIAKPLQGRHRDRGHTLGDRSGRQQPQHQEMEVLGCPQDRDTIGSRVESVEVQERRGDDGLIVYNLEVAEHHNYFANGVLVGNCHYLKNATTARTRAILGTHCDGAKGLGKWAAHVWFLSGTPMSNDPIDIWPWMRFVGATTLGIGPFTTRYFKSQMGAFSARQTPRDEMVPELRAAITAHSLRRTKQQAGLQLPPIWLTTQTVDGDTAEIRDLLRQWPDLEAAIIEAIEQGGLSFIEAQHIATLRRLVGEAKAPAFVKLMEEELTAGLDKVVIMGVHKRALAIVAQGLERFGVVMIDGSVSEALRVEAVQKFQNDPETRVFIGNVKAAGTGLTLTAASDIVMLESSWSPADNAQALMRVHRIGQKSTVRARFISLAGSIDEVVSEAVARKTAAIAKIQPQGEV